MTNKNTRNKILNVVWTRDHVNLITNWYTLQRKNIFFTSKKSLAKIFVWLKIPITFMKKPTRHPRGWSVCYINDLIRSSKSIANAGWSYTSDAGWIFWTKKSSIEVPASYHIQYWEFISISISKPYRCIRSRTIQL
jgi:hypothetical protein